MKNVRISIVIEDLPKAKGSVAKLYKHIGLEQSAVFKIKLYLPDTYNNYLVKKGFIADIIANDLEDAKVKLKEYMDTNFGTTMYYLAGSVVSSLITYDVGLFMKTHRNVYFHIDKREVVEHHIRACDNYIEMATERLADIKFQLKSQQEHKMLLIHQLNNL